MTSELLSLAAAAETLGVHYMTAYRYVRTGRLPAVKRAGQWWIETADLEKIRRESVPAAATASAPAAKKAQTTFLARAPQLLRSRSIAGDEAGAWAIVSEALSYGGSPNDVHLQIISPMMFQLGADWREGTVTISQEHRASVIVARIIARLGPLFAQRGRRRASIVLGAVAGEHHGLPIMMLADLLTGRGFAVTNLGPNTPPAAFVDTCAAIDGEVAIGLSAVGERARDGLTSCVATLRHELPTTPIFVGGPVGCDMASELDIAGSANSGDDAIALFEAHFPRSRETANPLP